MTSASRPSAPCLAGALCWIVTAVAFAQGNLLVTNPEFDDGLTGWTTGPAQVSTAADDSDDCPQSFSFSGAATGPGSPSIVGISSLDCVPVAQGDVLVLEVTYRAESPVYLEPLLYGGTACSLPFLSELGPPLPAVGEWTIGRRSFVVQPANATGVRLAVIGRIDPGPASFMLDVDRAYLGRRERIFADDFDASSICRWSNAN